MTTRLPRVTPLLFVALASAGAGFLLQASFEATPVAASSSAQRRGREAFVVRGCGHCHGDHRQGTDRAPELLTVRKRLDKDAITKQIHDGGHMMPAFGQDLSNGEIDDLVAYVRDKKEPSTRPGSNTSTPNSDAH